MTYQLETLSTVAVPQGDIKRLTLAPRPKSLQGQRIGLLWNGKHGGDVALRRVGQALEGRFPGSQVTLFRTAIPCVPALMEEIKRSECTVFLGSTGD